MKHRAKPRPTQQPNYIFQVESLSHEGRGIAHYGSHPDHPADKQGKKSLLAMHCRVKRLKRRLPMR